MAEDRFRRLRSLFGGDLKANEAVVIERNDNYFGEPAKLKRVIYRHMRESTGQRLALENGDIDIARNLEPGDLDAVAKNADLAAISAPKGTVYYISLNQKNPNLAKPEVVEAFKYLVDYDGIGATLIKGIGEIHRRSCPRASSALSTTSRSPSTLPRPRNCSPKPPRGRLHGDHGRA